MTVKEILGECLVKLGGKNFIDNATYSLIEKALLEKLLAALNIVYRGAVAENLPFVTEENVTLAENCVDTAALQKNIVYPIWLKADGVKHKLSCVSSKIVSDYSGRGTLKYAYIPLPLLIDGVIGEMRLTAALMSDGTLAEYHFGNRMFDLAQSYDGDFRASLSRAKYKGKEMRYFIGRG